MMHVHDDEGDWKWWIVNWWHSDSCCQHRDFDSTYFSFCSMRHHKGIRQINNERMIDIDSRQSTVTVLSEPWAEVLGERAEGKAWRANRRVLWEPESQPPSCFLIVRDVMWCDVMWCDAVVLTAPVCLRNIHHSSHNSANLTGFFNTKQVIITPRIRI